MSSLNDFVPELSPVQDVAVGVGKAIVAQVPVVGAFAVEAISLDVQSRQAKRQHEFNVEVVRELERVQERLGMPLDVKEVASSDDFIAAVTRAQRVASETASSDKRRRLAAAVAQSGAWSGYNVNERSLFVRLVEELEPLHVWLLHYFVNPRAWLLANGFEDPYSRKLRGSIEEPLGDIFQANGGAWRDQGSQALEELTQRGLAGIPMNSIMTGAGMLAPRTTMRGQRFLQFLMEEDSAGAAVPEL